MEGVRGVTVTSRASVDISNFGFSSGTVRAERHGGEFLEAIDTRDTKGI